MRKLNSWQLIILILPIALIISFLLFAAAQQINHWQLNWIWAIFTILLVGWRWLLAKWTQPSTAENLALAIEAAQAELAALNDTPTTSNHDKIELAKTAIQAILNAAAKDPPLWEDSAIFWSRCQSLVTAIAQIFHPEVKYPLLNIYVPQAYGLMRGTLDDLDRWMQKLSPALNYVTVAQAYQAYQMYQKLEPSARKIAEIFNWAQWIFNPATALAKRASQNYSQQANQQLLANLNQMLREVALRNLARQAIALYSGNTLPSETFLSNAPTLPKAKTQTIREIIAQAEPTNTVAEKPVEILLVGRTGAGKSSLINTLFQLELAQVDLLPSTERLQSYQWQIGNQESLILWDSPGYEQADRADLKEPVMKLASSADLLLLVTPALDPALQMDINFLQDVKKVIPELPTIAIITQVDRLRPIREWEPPYDWVWGDRPKEKSIREATEYRQAVLGELCERVLPIVTSDRTANRQAWQQEALSLALIEAIAPAKQLRLARFLRDQEARIVAAAKIIDRYTFQMSTAQGLTALLKSPILQFISTLATGSPALAYILAEKIPIEQLPIAIGKLQIAYDLYTLLGNGNFDLLSLWPFLLADDVKKISPDRQAWAFGHALVELWGKNLPIEQLGDRISFYIKS